LVVSTFSALTDVSKQKDLTGFYHHLYKQAVGEEDSKDNIKMKQDKVNKDKLAVKDISDTAGTSKSSSKEQTERKTARQYRKRRNSSSESERDENKKAKFGENIETGSDFTGSGSSDNEEGKNKEKQEKKSTVDKEIKPDVFTSGSEEGEIRETNGAKRESERLGNSELTRANENEDGKKLKIETKGEKDRTTDEKEADKENKTVKPEPPKCSVWEKRTVGSVFEAALERYFARKAAKSAS
jgi:coiled-coil domain-containing protein 55